MRVSHWMFIAGVAGCSDPGLGSLPGDGGLDGGGDVAVDTGGDGVSTSEWKLLSGSPDGTFLIAGLQDRLLAFGAPSGVTSPETWELVGETWSKKASAGSPPNYAGTAGLGGTLVGTKGGAILVGGRVGSGACGSSSDCPTETWKYDVGSTTWSKLTAPPSCRQRSYAAFLGDKVLLIGGDLCSTSRATEGLRWDGASWGVVGVIGCGTSGTPPGFDGGNVGAEPGGARLIYTHISGDTWSWDGSKCERVTGAASGVAAGGFSENIMANDGSSLFMLTRAGVLEWMPATKSWAKVGPPPPLNSYGIGAIGKRTLAGVWQGSGSATLTYVWKG